MNNILNSLVELGYVDYFGIITVNVVGVKNIQNVLDVGTNLKNSLWKVLINERT